MDKGLWVFLNLVSYSMRSDLITMLKVPFDPHNPADREVVERVADIQIGLLSQPI